MGRGSGAWTEAEWAPILAPGQELLDAERSGGDSERHGRRRACPVGNPPTEVGPQGCHPQMALETVSLLGDAPGAPPQPSQEVPEPGVGMVDREEGVRPVPSRGSRVGAPEESARKEGPPEAPIERFLIGVQDHGGHRVHEGSEGTENLPDSRSRPGGTAAVERFMRGSSADL